jgi:hypothetical protein
VRASGLSRTAVTGLGGVRANSKQSCNACLCVAGGQLSTSKTNLMRYQKERKMLPSSKRRGGFSPFSGCWQLMVQLGIESEAVYIAQGLQNPPHPGGRLVRPNRHTPRHRRTTRSHEMTTATCRTLTQTHTYPSALLNMLSLLSRAQGAGVL